MSLAEEKYLLLTTFRKNGTPVPTPVWIVPLSGGRMGFTTEAGSGKVKRLRHTSRVTVQPCDSRGRTKAGTTAVDATAEVVTGATLAEIEAGLKAKYGFMVKVVNVMYGIRARLKRQKHAGEDCGVVVTLAAS